MNLILTSNFPATPTARVADSVHASATNPRIAWIPSHTDATGEAFIEARRAFGDLGLHEVELVDIDQDRDEVQLAYLHEYDVIFLTGVDAVRFRFNANRSGLSGRLRQCVMAGRLVIASSGGALLLTPNVSIMRLRQESVEDVLATRGRYDALGTVAYELLPHRDRWPSSVLDAVRTYSAGIDHDIVAMADGGAVFHLGEEPPVVLGSITRYRKGNIIEP